MVNITRGQILQTGTAKMLGTIMGSKTGRLWPAHDEQCESLYTHKAVMDDLWTPCNCAERKEERLSRLHRLKIWKMTPEDKDDAYPWAAAPVGIWVGWCHKCDKRVGQYWSFGAVLGHGLEHQRRAR